jgi:hypothetical protein
VAVPVASGSVGAPQATTTFGGHWIAGAVTSPPSCGSRS